MPAQPFTVKIDLDDLARRDLTDAVAMPSAIEGTKSSRGKRAHHGAGDDRMAARQRSERERANRASGAAGGRSYAFRRS